jgi:hypothetical protein
MPPSKPKPQDAVGEIVKEIEKRIAHLRSIEPHHARLGQYGLALKAMMHADAMEAVLRVIAEHAPARRTK